MKRGRERGGEKRTRELIGKEREYKTDEKCL